MNKSKGFIVISLLCVLAGCVTAVPRFVDASWPQPIKDAIEDNRVFIGMTAIQVRSSWGAPESIHKTIFSGGFSEQWVYGVYKVQYLYFRDGILETIQTYSEG